MPEASSHEFAEQEIRDIVLGAVADFAGKENIELHHHIVDDLRIDSLEFVELIQDIEGKLGLRLNDEQLANAQTVSDLVTIACAGEKEPELLAVNEK